MNKAGIIHNGRVIIHQDHATAPASFRHKNITNIKNNPISQVKLTLLTI